MKVGIVGSRGWTDKLRVDAFVDALPLDTVVVSGGARGVDSWAIEAASERGMDWTIKKPNLKTQPVFALAAKARNRAIVEASDHVFAFWDGDSPGTANTIAWAVALGKPIRVFLL